MFDFSNYDLRNVLGVDSLEECKFDSQEKVDSFKKWIDTMKDDPFYMTMFTMFLPNANIKEALDSLADDAQLSYDTYAAEHAKPIKPAPVDDSRVDDGIALETKLRIHKLVGEYVDNVLKPTVGDCVSTDEMNDVYSALYEYSCWLMKHE